MSHPPPTPKRKRSILHIPDALLHPGSWRGKRSRSGSRSGSPTDLGASTQGLANSQDATQTSTHPHSTSPESGPVVTHDRPPGGGQDTQDNAIPPLQTTPESLPTVRVGSPPTENSGRESWTGLEHALRALHLTTKICPPLHSAIDGLKSCLHIFEEAAKLRKDYDELANGLTAMVQLLIKHLPTASSKDMIDTITRISGDVVKEVEAIEKRQSRQKLRQMIGTSGDEDDLIRRYRKIEQLFRQLQAEASMSTWSDTKRHFVNTQLENLGPVKLATFNSKISMDIGRRSCTENTRTKILNDSTEWADDPKGAKIYWMNGMAGTGKTTIAYSLCERLDDTRQLAASFFCTRTSRECSEAKQIVPTISYQLARHSAPFRDALCGVLDKDPDVGNLGTAFQFRSLIAKPLLEAKEAIARNLVVVIDALDECNDPHAVRVVLDILFRFAPDSPIKFFVTSRPEPAIRDSMMAGIGVHDRPHAILYLHEIEKSLVQADIELYLKDELKHILPTHQSDVEELAEQAGNLFIYAATAIRYIQAAGKAFNSKRLRTVLGVSNTSNKSLSAIDALYSAILSAAIHDNDLEPDEQGYIQTVLWTAICTCEPILIDTLAALSDLSETELAVSALQPLRSVLHVSEHNSLVTTLHASFPDFMFSQERSKDFFCDKVIHGQFLSRRCLEVMKAQLRFNICHLQSSFDLDDEIPNIKNRVETHISPELFYASRFWVDHLTQGGAFDSLVGMIHEFLSQRLLFWMEVLNLKKCIVTGAVASTALHMWLRTFNASPDLIAIASYAQMFVGKYASNPISASTPHIYVSALPFSSPTSLIRSIYGPRFKGLVQATGRLLEQTDRAELETWSIGSPIRSASFSADRKCIVIGDDNGRISIKDSHTGTIVKEFKAHRKPITSVAFSNDGDLVVSGSHDCTICIWSTNSGSLVSGPFKGHSNRVNSVAFSPDGTRLASGSTDCTIRTWATHNWTDSKFLARHTGPVRSVTFSPDGFQIASGSDDHTVRIWDGLSGALLHSLQGHSQPVNCVRFSPSAAFVLSGSTDCTIRMWDPHSGTPTSNPFRGHSKRITSIAISPEGERIVSCSLDHTVRVWHRATGELMAGPFEGHTNPVRSVEFSADGVCIVSASDDKTVRVWNAQGRSTPCLEDPDTSISPISNTTMSPNGMHLASIHEDGSIRAWNTQRVLLETSWLFKDPEWKLSELFQFSSDGAHIFAAYKDGLQRILNAQTGELIENLLWPLPRESEDVGYMVSLSPDGRSAITRSFPKAYLWDLQIGRFVCEFYVKRDVFSLLGAVFSSNNAQFTTYNTGGQLESWDRFTGQRIAGPFQFDMHPIPSVGLSPDGNRIFYRSSRQGTCTYDVIDGTHTLLSIPTSLQWNCVIFSPNEAYIAFVNQNLLPPRLIGLYCVVRRQLISKLDFGSSYTDNLAFTSNESFLVSSHHGCDMMVYQFHMCISKAFSAPRNDGWVLEGNSNKAIWVPTEIRKELDDLWVDGASLTKSKLLSVDYEGILIGDKWSQCYVGE